VLRFINTILYSFSETEHFHRGSRPYGASSRSYRRVIPLNPTGGAAAPPGHPLGVRPIHFAYVTEFSKGRTKLQALVMIYGHSESP
jgi:hypothetical protein